ncbi:MULTISPECIES: nickel pincer cofactor biosynthesis protein LarC [Oscillospiraceae]|uniref:nickel pincer cofactor biosynthesis protein LarC n=1 Tax=Oscillospiraceae TaxID=216572 RepID=UPI0003AE318C|nr:MULTISPECIES: nickel pincer cofactor biosynthesis protein LarC [unclassified Oscillibacter]ERK56607.1 TIGR00299 family protein [Oscillibacter sp. KLE 1745]ERK64532.1 TIGR00299 family protein [Oscillibacter sp. KLE 1728]
MKTLFIECNMGAAGDMLMAALYELLEDRQAFLDAMNALGLPGVRVEAQAAATCGIAGTHMTVAVHGQEETGGSVPAEAPHPHVHSHGEAHGHDHDYHHHHDHDHDHPHDHGEGHHHYHATPGHIGELLDGLPLPEEVRRRARRVYDAIARAEAKAHGCPVGDVHFHEVGALDAVADVAGVCYALYLLAPERIVVSPIHVGSGTVRCAHGVMPVPAPATANLLSGVPICGGTIQGELCTPTGAALLTSFADAYGPMPVMVTKAVGVGIGTKQFQQANCVRAFLGETVEEANGEILELVCNVDDMTPEALSFAASRLLEAGALDVYTLPGTMKKGRPGHVLTVLCVPEQEGELARRILAETTTNGLRVRRCGKYFLTPGAGMVQTRWGPVKLKLARGYGITHVKPEFEDAAELAREHDVPYQAVLQEALGQLRQEDFRK